MTRDNQAFGHSRSTPPAFDEMRDDQLRAFLGGLANNSDFAARVGRERPLSDPLVAAVHAESAPSLPTNAEWSTMWDRISQRARPQTAISLAAQPRIFRLWTGLTAVAASILVMIALSGVARGPAVQEMRLAESVEIDDLETSDGITPMIWNADGVSVIWLIQEEG